MKLIDDEGFPLPPHKAAEEIVSGLLADLPAERKDALREAIEKWGKSWGDFEYRLAYGSATAFR
jgi:hypothetical protein